MLPRFNVLLDDPESLDHHLNTVARVVAQLTEQPVPDAFNRVRYGRGIVLREQPIGVARDLIRALAHLQLGSFLVPAADVPATPRPRRVGRCAFAPEGLRLSLRGREDLPPQHADWSDVIAVHVSALAQEASEEREVLPRKGDALGTLSATTRGLLTALRRFQEKERTTIRLSIDVIADGPRLYRLHSDDVGIYTELPQRSKHSLENFLLLLQTLLERAPSNVLVPRGTRALAAEGDIDLVLYTKREGLESFTSWLIQAHAAGVGFEGTVDDLDDDELLDADEAILVADDVDDGAAEDLDDVEFDEGSGEELEDADEEREEEPADWQRVSGGEGEDGARADDSALDEEDLDDLDADDLEEPNVAGDEEVQQALEHFENTSQLDADAIEAMLTQSRDLEEDLDEVELDDPEVERALGFFEGPSGRWDVGKLLGEDAEG